MLLPLSPPEYAILIAAYLLGSIPFGLILSRLAGLGDITRQGSGNIGATNVTRLGGKKLGLLTLLLDGGKGAVAVLLAEWFFPGSPLVAVAGALSVLGHVFPLWLKFKGGKGVATTLAVLLAISWPVGLCACAVWLITFALFRISSLSALTSMALTPLFTSFYSPSPIAFLTLFLAVLVILRHHQNIRRLLEGSEKSKKEKK